MIIIHLAILILILGSNQEYFNSWFLYLFHVQMKQPQELKFSSDIFRRFI